MSKERRIYTLGESFDGLISACASLMNGHEPEWDKLPLNMNTREEIVKRAEAERIVRIATEENERGGK